MSNSIFDWFALFAENAFVYGGAFILVLSLLVFVHEWGHYIVARMCGVRVESFSIGFGKEIFGFTDKNNTRWKFSMIPLGGYVKMFGDLDPASAGHSDSVAEGSKTNDDDTAKNKVAAVPATPEVRPMTDEERKVAFFSQSVGKRSAIVVAGPAINFIFAIILMAGLYTFYGQPVTPPVATSVVGGSAAEEAGFQPHDQVISIGGKKVLRFEDIRREVMVSLDTEKTYVVLRDGEEVEIQATPNRVEGEDRFGFKHTRGLLGLISPGNGVQISTITEIDGVAVEGEEAIRDEIIRRMDTAFNVTIDRGERKDVLLIEPFARYNEDLGTEGAPTFNILNISEQQEEFFVKHDPFSAFIFAIHETGNITMSTLESLGQMFTGTRSATELGGIIRIGAIAGDMAKSGLIAIIMFTALLSINLGLINLFPIPMLDGGHLFFYGIEAARGKPLSERVQEYAFRFGLVILFGIMIFANLNDLVQLIL
jgi:regulator of sigma E protease